MRITGVDARAGSAARAGVAGALLCGVVDSAALTVVMRVTREDGFEIYNLRKLLFLVWYAVGACSLVQ